MTNHDLRAAAQAATPDYSELRYLADLLIEFRVANEKWEWTAEADPKSAYAQFIRLASPDLILALCEENKELRAVLEGIIDIFSNENIRPAEAAFQMVGIARAALEAREPAPSSEKERAE